MTSIKLIVVYLGTWPAYLPVFLHSCRSNPSVSFLLLTDCGTPPDPPPNVQFVPFSLAQFNRLASEKLGQAIAVGSPYKLCDFKPAYGRIFEDWLTDAAFWGHTEIDLVFGDIRRFLTEDILREHDVISARREYLVGHFTLYRNTGFATRLYEHSRDYRHVFSSPECVSFDECNGLWQPLACGVPVPDTRPRVDSMTHVAFRLHQAGRIRLHLRTLVEEQASVIGLPWNGKLRWSRGRLLDLRIGGEWMYFHFHFLKKSRGFVIEPWPSEPPDTLEIDATGIIPHARSRLRAPAV
jgi:hypothetical protein